MLINFSNHPSASWSADQIGMAIQHYGYVKDVAFPLIEPEDTVEAIYRCAESYGIQLAAMVYADQKENRGFPTVVHIMGEMTFTYAMVSSLSERGILCIASTSRRDVRIESDGSKLSFFRFVRFRPYLLSNSDPSH